MKSQEREKVLSPFFPSLSKESVFCSPFSPAQGAALRCAYFLWTINDAVTPVPVSGSLPRSVRAQLPFQGEWGQFYFRWLRGLHLQAPRGSGCLPCGNPCLGCWPGRWRLQPAFPPSPLPGCVSAQAWKRRRCLSGHTPRSQRPALSMSHPLPLPRPQLQESRPASAQAHFCHSHRYAVRSSRLKV